jgi:hypothetical protein
MYIATDRKYIMSSLKPIGHLVSAANPAAFSSYLFSQKTINAVEIIGSPASAESPIFIMAIFLVK